MTAPASGKKLAAMQCILGGLAGSAAWTFAPDLDSASQHEAFSPFFATAAQVIAAVLVALAVEARLAVRHELLAITSAICLATGGVSAVAALSPVLPDFAYSWLFAGTVAGGTGAMFAAIVIGSQTLIAETHAVARQELDAVADRAERDKRGA